MSDEDEEYESGPTDKGEGRFPRTSASVVNKKKSRRRKKTPKDERIRIMGLLSQ